jgi:hypothetical protein
MKNIWFLILAIVLILALTKVIKPKIKPIVNVSKPKNMYTPDDAKAAILTIQKMYGSEMAKLVEKMARLETAHFKSGQFQQTGTAGMEAGAWGKYLPGPPKPTVKLRDPVLGMRDFIVWNPQDFFIFLAEYIKRYKGNFARWNTTDPKRQIEYAKKVNSIIPRFVV